MDIVHSDYHDIIRDRVRQVRKEGTAVPLIEEKFIRAENYTTGIH